MWKFKVLSILLMFGKFIFLSGQKMDLFTSVNATLPSVVFADDWNPNKFGPEDNYKEKMGFGRGINLNLGVRLSRFELGLAFNQYLIIKEDFPPPKSLSKYRFTRVNIVTLGLFASYSILVNRDYSLNVGLGNSLISKVGNNKTYTTFDNDSTVFGTVEFPLLNVFALDLIFNYKLNSKVFVSGGLTINKIRHELPEEDKDRIYNMRYQDMSNASGVYYGLKFGIGYNLISSN